MKIPSLLRTSTFQLALLYMVVFASSVFVLLAFIYWQTAGFISEQTDETIEAEIVGLAEQYRSRGINGLISIIRERVSRDPQGKSLYLFTTKDYRKLAGNLAHWPNTRTVTNGWINFQLDESMGWKGEPREARARVFEVQGGLRLLVGRDVQELATLRDLIERAINWGMAITLALALVGGIMMSRGTTRRIEVINGTAQRIMNGDLSLRIPTRGTEDDFDQLADNLNQMLDRIVYLMEGIRHVSDNIAHDLRTPLTRLRSKLENTLLVVDDPQAQEEVGRAVEEADQLLATFNALLRIARLETGGKQFEKSPVQLGDLVNDAVELYEALAEDKEQAIKCRVDNNPVVMGDRDLLFQMISNLIDNAIKYTPEGGEIRIEVGAYDGEAVLEVADSGQGIPDDEKKKVFQRFYRVTKSRSKPGNGLGLSLVNAVMDIHSGRVELRDRFEGQEQPGLRVILTFPREWEGRKKKRLKGQSAVSDKPEAKDIASVSSSAADQS
ncbi:ATP-binding protein [Marinobacteraceae bacterium S3BR75-40.1]